MAQSVVGPQEAISTWRATSNGLEATAERHNDNILCLDEFGELDPREAGACAYMLANGQGKSRMSKDCTAQKSAQWKLIGASTGETSLVDSTRACGGEHRGGHAVRFVDIPADAECGMGLFEDLHGAAGPAQFAQLLSAAAQANYGTALRAFLQYLVDSGGAAVEKLKSKISAFLVSHLPGDLPGGARRVGMRFALVAAAGELATEAGITGWPAGEAEAAAVRCMHAWLAAGGSAPTDAVSVIEKVRTFLGVYGQSRFQSIGGATSERVLNRAGFRQLNPDGTFDFLVLPTVFRDEVCKGFDPRFAVQVLQGKGYLDGEGGRTTVRRAIEGFGRSRFYWLKSTILSEGD